MTTIIDTKPSAELISIKEAAERLEVTLQTVYGWLRQTPPRISYVEIAGDVFIPALEVARIRRERNNKSNQQCHNISKGRRVYG